MREEMLLSLPPMVSNNLSFSVKAVVMEDPRRVVFTRSTTRTSGREEKTVVLAFASTQIA